MKQTYPLRFTKSTTCFSIALLCVSAAMPSFGQAERKTILAPAEAPTHRFTEIAKDVYFVVGTGSVFVQSNSMLIVNENDAIVVDSHVTPAAAEALLRAVAEVTDKPVRYLINTHYHFDHAHGNQVFPEDVDIIGHEYTRMKLLGNVLEEATFLSFTTGFPEEIETLKQRIDAMTDGDEKRALKERLAIRQAHVASLKETVPTPPTVTLHKKMSIFRGDREVQLIFLGRGHTGGDVVVYLPKEKIVFTGDLMLPFLTYMGDGFVDEWIPTLEALKGLDFQTALPGHGGPFTDKKLISNFQTLLEDLWKQALDLKKRGVSHEEAALKIDLTAHSKNYRQIQEPGVDPRAVKRIYELVDSRNN